MQSKISKIYCRVISGAYDNKIKVWDFLTMECINTINGAENSKQNIEMSTMCYLDRNSLVAIGTDIGRIYFWDLSKSRYLKNDYESYLRHKSYVSCIINSTSTKGKEYLFTCGKY